MNRSGAMATPTCVLGFEGRSLSCLANYTADPNRQSLYRAGKNISPLKLFIFISGATKKVYPYTKFRIMFKKFTITDKFLFVSAMLSLIFSEILYFQGAKQEGIFIGIWVPSILAFGIYLKLIKNSKND